MVLSAVKIDVSAAICKVVQNWCETPFVCFGMAECDGNLVQAVNLLPLKNSISKVWKFFGFRHESGVIMDHSHVSQ